MIYADYAYYTDTYYGDTIESEDDFLKFATRACRYIDRITMNRAESYATLRPEDPALKNACCAAADQYRMIAAARAAAASEDGEIASESVGSHSVSYRSGLETAATLEAELRKVVESYLATTGLLYRGIPNVHASYSYSGYL